MLQTARQNTCIFCVSLGKTLLIFRGTDEEGQLYGFALTSGKRYVEQRKLFSQYLANTKKTFDDIIGDEASVMCNKVISKQCSFIQMLKMCSSFLDSPHKKLVHNNCFH